MASVFYNNYYYFAAVASEVVASLVCRYENLKAHPHKEWRSVEIFLLKLQAFVN